MTRTQPTLRRVSRSSPLPSVRFDYPLLYPDLRDPPNNGAELDEEGTRISLTIVDTPGFGDLIDNEARYVYPEPVTPLGTN